MSYVINFDELDGNLFLLQQLVLASENYCSQEMIGSDLDIGDGKLDVYWGWVKGIVSDYLVDCAIKTRIFQDYLSENENTINLDSAKADLESRKNLTIGIIHEGSFELTLRESCNKIIHAKKSIPSWSEKEKAGKVFKYWNGSFDLYGSKGNRNWHLELRVGDWAKAMSLYHDMLDSSEGRIYVGQDW
jgi:hypothetical protein